MAESQKAMQLTLGESGNHSLYLFVIWTIHIVFY